ncbi:MAG: hypothetical protein FWF24_03250 [Alphaproteobacteria bacterium]|nr:hypothetical protein [Alphaproteobacteria bacterium]
MSDDYVAAKVKEALEAVSGVQKDAVKLLLTWAVRDQALLIGLAKPHLKAEVTARVHAFVKAQKYEGEEEQQPLGAFSFPSAKGERRHHPTTPPPKASDNHVSVMNQIAQAFKKKKS